jgi:hypothetical protein
MSRHYSMAVTITGAAAEHVEAVKQAAEAEWPFDDWFLGDDAVLTASAEDWLCGGETEEEFAERLAKAIWAANAAPCQVDIDATYLEELPYESYSLDDHDYDRLMSSTS